MEKYITKSYAKLNLHLEVGALMPNNFHEINSIFHAIDLHDLIEFNFIQNKKEINILTEMNIAKEDNLLYKAAKLYLDYTNADFGVEIKIQKNIPLGAGLGGGSSNAASVLLTLNNYNKDILSSDELKKLAAELGSDVPFFIGSTAALVKGRGEIISPIPAINYSGILIVPEVHVNTGFAYGLIDKNGYNKEEFLINPQADLLKIPSKWQYENTFTKPLVDYYPEINKAIEALTSEIPGYIAMSGSGSSVFKIFDTENDVLAEYNRIKEAFTHIYIINLLEKFEKPAYN